METEEQLFGLMEIAERQQSAVQAALDGLVAERVTLRLVVQQAVEDGLNRSANLGAKTVQASAVPLLGRLEKLASRAGEVEASLHRVVQWTSWQMLGKGLAAFAALTLLGWFAASTVLWWDVNAIGSLQARKAALEMQIATMQANRAEWQKAGMLGKIEHCGPDGRPCIRVDERPGGFGEVGDYRVIAGY